jgi:hypothetical protein
MDINKNNISPCHKKKIWRFFKRVKIICTILVRSYISIPLAKKKGRLPFP